MELTQGTMIQKKNSYSKLVKLDKLRDDDLQTTKLTHKQFTLVEFYFSNIPKPAEEDFEKAKLIEADDQSQVNYEEMDDDIQEDINGLSDLIRRAMTRFVYLLS